MVLEVPIREVIADPRCQSRTGIEPALVHEYAQALRDGAELPPLSVIKTDAGYYLYDGFHRLQAYRAAGKSVVPVNATPGDLWDAIERSCAVNATHGKRRTPADTKRAVETILKVMQHRGVKWTQGEIADKCAITQQRVSQMLQEVPSYKDLYDGSASNPTVTRNGTTYPMNTSNIGKWRAPSLSDLAAHDEEEIDEDTGEILSGEPPPYEVVDPRDPGSYAWDPPTRTQSSHTEEQEDEEDDEEEPDEEEPDEVADALFDLIERFGKSEVLRVVHLYLLS
jgi:hypothetical protein